MKMKLLGNVELTETPEFESWADSITEDDKAIQMDAESLRVSLESALVKRVVFFVFQKKDGSFREAMGTKCPMFIPDKRKEELIHSMKEKLRHYRHEYATYNKDIPYETDDIKQEIESIDARLKMYDDIYNPEPKDKAPNLEVVTYFDFGSNGWRSCRAENVVMMLDFV